MKYVLMLAGNEKIDAEITEAEAGEMMANFDRFDQWCAANGVKILLGEALEGSGAATTLRPRGGRKGAAPQVDGEIVVTDGPYAELKEQVGALYLIEARDLDQAIEAARQCPLFDATEIRPVMVMPES